MWLIIGLGNPGEQYTRTRHNIGFECLKHLAHRHGLDFTARRASARIAEGRIGNQRVALAKPTTYMNLSGKAVVALRNWYKVDAAEQMLVIYDDLDLPFGKLRVRQRGSAGTHNGMRSIVQLLGTQEFPRLRVGIDRPPAGWDTRGYVLGRFSKEEAEALPALYEQVSDLVEVVLRDGLVMAMNRYNS